MTTPTPTSTEREALRTWLQTHGGCLDENDGDDLLDEFIDTYLAAHDADLVQRTREQVAKEIEAIRDRRWTFDEVATRSLVDVYNEVIAIAREGGAR